MATLQTFYGDRIDLLVRRYYPDADFAEAMVWFALTNPQLLRSITPAIGTEFSVTAIGHIRYNELVP